MRLSNWLQYKTWADTFWPEIECIIRGCAGIIIDVVIAADEDDRQHATDYVVTVSSGTIACRVRRWYAWQKFRDITLRSELTSGTQTEIDKIRAGWGRWYLYGWAVDDATFGAWVFIDLDKLRASRLLDDDRPAIWNNDHGSSFVPFSLGELAENNCVVAIGGEAANIMSTA